jgi:S-adenosylmethionine-diacylgycerolhomoserine-N-methlytransferase
MIFTSPVFLLGRDELLDSLHPKINEIICEVGCGTARNLIYLAKTYHNTNFIGMDASALMLEIANKKVKKEKLATQIKLVHGLAGEYEFEQKIDRMIFSYSLSMMSKPREILENCLAQMPPGGIIHIIDFGDFKLWPGFFKAPTIKFLNLFEFFPKPDSVKDFETDKKYVLNYKTKLGGYSYLATLKIAGI